MEGLRRLPACNAGRAALPAVLPHLPGVTRGRSPCSQQQGSSSRQECSKLQRPSNRVRYNRWLGREAEMGRAREEILCWLLPRRQRRQRQLAQQPRPHPQLPRPQQWQRNCRHCQQWPHRGRGPRWHPSPAPHPPPLLQSRHCRRPFGSSSSSSRSHPHRARQLSADCSPRSQP